MRVFCTIITKNYIPYAATLLRSLQRLQPSEQLVALIVDNDGGAPGNPMPGMRYIRMDDIYKVANADLIYANYADKNADALRWGLKPVLLEYLLAEGCEKVIYADCDLFFFSGYEFLFDELNNYSVLLTPGGTTRNPMQHEEEFLSGYKYGQFNAGLVGVNKEAIPMLRWWGRCCAYRVETNFADGLFVDQKYLDAVPVLFPNAGIVRHKGCNVAFWNQHEYNRVQQGKEVLINGEYPVVFIHFTNLYIPELLNGNDPLLYPYYLTFEKTFRESGHSLEEFIKEMPVHHTPGPLVRLKRKLLLRTRIKRWLYRLSQK
ncbi:MAG: hypothetical protein JNM88_02770 [Chitinophagaceae bacterium]|nr:hypothetical protein [Chitinophagaceae bacterium]